MRTKSSPGSLSAQNQINHSIFYTFHESLNLSQEKKNKTGENSITTLIESRRDKRKFNLVREVKKKTPNHFNH